jgi:hypothetical protein
MKYVVMRPKGRGSIQDIFPSSVIRRRLKATHLRQAILLFTLLPILACSDSKQADVSTGRSLGATSTVGNGTVSSYAELDKNGAPRAIGIVFQASALEGLPSAVSDEHHCFDRNQDGKIDPQTECFAAHEWIIPLPSEAARRPDVLFKWIGLNWNPHGHIPPKVYDLPHFDVHFYIDPIEKIFAIESGPCGHEFVRCDQFKIATKPLPANYMHADFKNVDAVAPAMGNHLIDPTSPEFHGKKFTRTWVYGVYDGRVTFFEEMLTREYMLSQPSACFPIKSPPAVNVRGYYPTQSCTRYHSQTNEYTVSMEGFTLREASAAEAIRVER